jgi:hypothetical protein
MARHLSSERPFLVITDVEAHPLLDSYRIMNAVQVTPDFSGNFSDYGTVICFSTHDYFAAFASQCTSRFFGILLKGEEMTILPKSKYVTAKLESAYIGIPTEHTATDCPGFWSVTYPHITVVPPNHKIHNYAGMLRTYEYEYSELISTENTYTHHVRLENDPHHITRMVRDGMKPVIAGKEIVCGTHYTRCTGHAVIM